MELKAWTYEEFPAFSADVPGAAWLDTTGEERGIAYLHDVEYAAPDGHHLHLQIQIPDSRNHRFDPAAPKQAFCYPCVAFVQGSAWMEQYMYANVAHLSRLTAMGYVTAAVQYRHSGLASFPAQAEDTRNAIRFLRANAGKFGIDPDRIAVAGDSSGGHTAMWAALLEDDESERNLYPGISAKTRAVINYYGAVSTMGEANYPSTPNYLQPETPEGMLMGGVNLREHPDLREQMSVECNINEDTDLPPVLIFHGTKDRTVNANQSARLFNRLRECRKEAQLYFLKGADHGGAEFWSEKVLGIVDDFLRKHMG